MTDLKTWDLINLSIIDGLQIKRVFQWVSGLDSDFGNLRFKDSDSNPISYFVESQNDGIDATVWLKLPIGVSRIIMWADTPDSESLSSPTDVFNLYDVFDDLSQWTDTSNSGGTPSVSGNELILTANGANLNTAVTSNDACIVDETITEVTISRHDGYQYGPVARVDPPWYGDAASYYEFTGIYGGNVGYWGHRYYTGTNYQYDMGTKPSTFPFTLTIRRSAGQLVITDGVNTTTLSGIARNPQLAYPSQLVLFNRGVTGALTGTIKISKVIVRRYATVEPTLVEVVDHSAWTEISSWMVLNGLSQNDVQIRHTLPWISGLDSDFGNMRILDQDDHEVSFWIEEKTDGVEAVVWLKLQPYTEWLYVYAAGTGSESWSNGFAITYVDTPPTLMDGDLILSSLIIDQAIGAGLVSADKNEPFHQVIEIFETTPAYARLSDIFVELVINDIIGDIEYRFAHRIEIEVSASQPGGQQANEVLLVEEILAFNVLFEELEYIHTEVINSKLPFSGLRIVSWGSEQANS